MTIERHKTALSRNNYSRPVQHLLKSNLLSETMTFFDYGCGKGDDVSALKTLGHAAEGWDPHYFKKVDKTKSDIVNLGFVLNVIEDIKERDEALKKAWALSKTALIISVISIWDRPETDLRPYGDGLVTSKGTFQKYYEPGELKEYVDQVLGIECLPVDPMMVIVFRSDDDLQEYLSQNESGVSKRRQLEVPLHPVRKTRISKAIEDFKTNAPEKWRELSEIVFQYAMAPSPKNFQGIEILESHGVKPIDFLQVLIEMIGNEEWKQILKRTIDYYKTRLALSMFRGKPKSSHYTDEDKRSIRTHFGSFDKAIEASKETLFSVGNPRVVADLCNACSYGVLDDQALYLHKSLVPQVDAVLQAYIGIGRLFYGELNDIDLFKIHKESSKLTLLIYDDFENEEQPILNTRIKISYRERQIRFFDHRRDQQLLSDKKLYM